MTKRGIAHGFKDLPKTTMTLKRKKKKKKRQINRIKQKNKDKKCKHLRETAAREREQVGEKRGKEAMRLPKSKDCSRHTDCLKRKSINIDQNAVTTGGVYVSRTAHCTKPITIGMWTYA